MVWSTDGDGNYLTSITGYAVSGNDYSLQALESTFHQDLNGDGTIGPVSVVTQMNGSTSLSEVANKFYLYDDAWGSSTLKYAGQDFVVGQFGAWMPIGAVKTANGYDVAWKVAGADQYTVWSTDSNGNYIASITGYAVPGTDPSLQALEATFHQDLNGDGKILIQTDGATSLTEVANKFYLYDGSGTGPTLKYAGQDFVAGQFGGWAPIGAVQTANRYDVAWKVTGADQYVVWSTDSNGNYTASITGYAVSGTDHSLEALETTFHQDLNGDGVVGVYTPGTFSLQYKGFAYVSSYNGAYENSDSLPSLVRTGANSIEATIGYGIDVATSQVVVDHNYTDSLNALGKTIAEAEGFGLSVMVRPLIGFLDPAVVAPYSVGAWRQSYQPTDVATFFASYKQMLIAEAVVAQQNGAQMLSVGAELDQLAGPQYLSYWTDIISSVRTVFDGALTYAANWDTASNVSFWSQLNYEGLDCYVPLSNAQNPTLQDLIDGWLKPASASANPVAYAAMGNQSPIHYFESLAAQSGKPLLFTELGYANDSAAAAEPWISDNHPAPGLQAELYQAFFQAWAQSGSSALQGTYFWDWDPNGGSSNVGPGIDSFSPQNSPAQDQAMAGFATLIKGDAGNNILTAGWGIDTFTGGGGADTFVFPDTYSNAVAGQRDTITDFTPGTDKIDLSAIDSHFSSGDHAFEFIGNAAFDGHPGELHYSYDAAHNVTILEGDTTGGKTASFGIELTGNLALTTADFTAASLLHPVNLTATANNMTLTGGPLDDTLNDGGFAVTMVGGLGNDTYVVSNPGDVLVETAGSAYAPPAGWSVMGTADFNKDGTLDVVLSNGTADEFQLLTSSGAVVSTVPALSWDGWQLQGTIDFDYDGNPDLLFQRIGSQQEVDYLNGTSWTGRYSGVSGVTPDALHPLPGGDQDTDTVLSSVSYALPSGVENLTLIGTGNLNGTGNGLDNIITANSGNNVLTGGGGNDTFVFGPNFGKDSITDFHLGDTIQFDHTVFATVSAVLAALGTDAHGNATITANANEAVTVDHVSATLLQQHSDAFHLK